jgi:hypothetical protein
LLVVISRPTSVIRAPEVSKGIRRGAGDGEEFAVEIEGDVVCILVRYRDLR